MILGMEYIKVLLHKNKMVGAILIGETDLEVNIMSINIGISIVIFDRKHLKI